MVGWHQSFEETYIQCSSEDGSSMS
jgi:hypothetical protein